jgi:trimeric autotransporter adhesin
MFDRRHPQGWLFYLLLVVLVLPKMSSGQSPATTTVSDTVYRADGTLAGGTLLISWPTFSTAGGQSVVAGTKSVTLGPGGTLSVALVPNTGGTHYTVVYQLDDASTPPKYSRYTTALHLKFPL